ncbi:nitrous oxide reductase accessory protein NosL [Peribacillus huizhouensis]|uniref:Copper chaperone NosL n=1 Tax=Peribacillus huizhouensis TaxID=1501239 RepID=A0ABR6CQE3_9BACI|nr:nitrous oxide reductase accessory protein NosL [Peribacillus huizhouensis]MBA9026562.1 copper chaperone NosL [Peribacillus huizhouensis]
MKKKLLSFIVLAGLIMILAACGNDKAQPVSINEATDTCETCNMAVIDNQHATQIILENGKSMVFDDVGCMYEWVTKHENEKIDAQFVRDYHDEEWILVDDATYVYNQSVKTPMAYNVISFKDKATAEEFAAENEGSTIMTANDLAEHDWKQKDDKANHSHSHSDDEKDDHSHSH